MRCFTRWCGAGWGSCVGELAYFLLSGIGFLTRRWKGLRRRSFRNHLSVRELSEKSIPLLAANRNHWLYAPFPRLATILSCRRFLRLSA
jgi:hypothetical protein